MKHQLPDYTTAQMSFLIDEHIHNIKYRNILKLRLLDGYTYEEIAEKANMSTQQIKTIVYKSQEKIIKYL